MMHSKTYGVFEVVSRVFDMASSMGINSKILIPMGYLLVVAMYQSNLIMVNNL